MADRASSSTCPRRSPARTSRWAPIQRTPEPKAIGASVLRGRARPRSARAARRRLKAEAAQHGPTLWTAEQVEEGPRERRLLGRRHDRAGVHDRAIAVVGRAEGLLHA